MIFVFRPEHLVGLANGTLNQVVSATGVPLSMVRDALTGQIVGHAVGMVGEPVLAIPDLVMGVAGLIQTHMGFQETYRRLDVIQAGLQSLQNSVGVLQATTAAIGVGTVAGVALSAVNLHQMLKLRQDVNQLRLEVKDGFIDMKQALKDRGEEIRLHIDRVATDVEFKHHRTILVVAYGHFIEGINSLGDALKIQNEKRRNAGIETARSMLRHALADYNNPQLSEHTNSAGQLRRRECAWAIDQAITTTYHLQGEYEVVSDRLSQLQDKIRRDSLAIIDNCETEEELNFIFPEITRIHNQDLAVLESWQNQVDWVQTLTPDDRQVLASSDMTPTPTSAPGDLAVVAEPEEELLYNNLKQKSHFLSLRDQIKFMLKPELRRIHSDYISQQATASGYKALAPSNWQEIPDLTVANLYWYFRKKD